MTERQTADEELQSLVPLNRQNAFWIVETAGDDPCFVTAYCRRSFGGTARELSRIVDNLKAAGWTVYQRM